METENWERLGQAVRARRKHLGLAQVDVSAAGGPSDETLRRLERGEPGPYMRRTLASLERVLRWKPGATEAISAGEDPSEWELVSEFRHVSDSAGGSDRTSASQVTARDRAVMALLDYADTLETPQGAATRTDVLAFVRRLMEQSVGSDH